MRLLGKSRFSPFFLGLVLFFAGLRAQALTVQVSVPDDPFTQELVRKIESALAYKKIRFSRSFAIPKEAIVEDEIIITGVMLTSHILTITQSSGTKSKTQSTTLVESYRESHRQLTIDIQKALYLWYEHLVSVMITRATGGVGDEIKTMYNVLPYTTNEIIDYIVEHNLWTDRSRYAVQASMRDRLGPRIGPPDVWVQPYRDGHPSDANGWTLPVWSIRALERGILDRSPMVRQEALRSLSTEVGHLSFRRGGVFSWELRDHYQKPEPRREFVGFYGGREADRESPNSDPHNYFPYFRALQSEALESPRITQALQKSARLYPDTALQIAEILKGRDARTTCEFSVVGGNTFVF
jgi:hypothetical protein